MGWLTHILPIAAAFLDQHGLVSAFLVLLLEEAGVPLPVPGDVLMLVVGVRVHQAYQVLWQVLAVMEAATVLGAGILYFAGPGTRRVRLPRGVHAAGLLRGTRDPGDPGTA